MPADPPCARCIPSTSPAPSPSTSISPSPTPDPAAEEICVLLSGGGHRATLFGLGVLLALVDTGANRRVRAISSVSGGSWLNGFVGIACNYRTVSRHRFDEVAGALIHHVTRRPRSGPGVAAGFAAAAGASWYLAHRLTSRAGPAWLAALATLVLLVLVLRRTAPTAHASGLIDAAMTVRQRDRPATRHPELGLLRAGLPPLTVDHVIVATDLDADHGRGCPLYLTGTGLHSPVHGHSDRSDGIRLATVLAASAAPALVAAPVRLDLGEAHPDRQRRRQWWRGRRLRLADGQLTDSLGLPWLDLDDDDRGYPRPRRVVIVNSTGSFPTHPALGWLAWPGWIRSLQILHRSTVAARLSAARDDLGSGTERGTVVAAEDTVLDVLARHPAGPAVDEARRRLGTTRWSQGRKWPLASPGGDRPDAGSGSGSGSNPGPGEAATAGTNPGGIPPWDYPRDRVASVPPFRHRLNRDDAASLLFHGYTLGLTGLAVDLGFDWPARPRTLDLFRELVAEARPGALRPDLGPVVGPDLGPDLGSGGALGPDLGLDLGSGAGLRCTRESPEPAAIEIPPWRVAARPAAPTGW